MVNARRAHDSCNQLATNSLNTLFGFVGIFGFFFGQKQLSEPKSTLSLTEQDGSWLARGPHHPERNA
jgi:hypothetical protein